MLPLIEEVVRRVGAGEAVGFCSVVRTHGSTPQRAGATMLVLADGRTIGTLGGGCVEAEVRVQALQLLPRRASQLLSFRLNQDYGWDDGLVCGGSMQVAVEVLDSTEKARPLLDCAATLRSGRAADLAMTVADESGRPQSFSIPLLPQPKLLIAGAGHVGGALAKLANEAGFAVTLIDDREDFLRPDRFPWAACIVGEIDQSLRRYDITDHTYIVIVTRGHRHDADALAAVIASCAKYVGLIGSRRKVIAILQQLQQLGVKRNLLERVHAPIGLDLGAVTPEEIAVSILAELIAVRRGKSDSAIGLMKLSAARLDRALAGDPDDARRDQGLADRHTGS